MRGGLYFWDGYPDAPPPGRDGPLPVNPAAFSRVLSQPRDFLTRFIGILLVLVAVLLIGYAEVAQHRFRVHQEELASRSVRGAAELVELYLSDAERALVLFADNHAVALGRLGRQPGDAELYDRLLAATRRHFPNAFAMALADQGGEVLVDDFGGRVEEVCRNDIRAFARADHPHEVVIHPNPLGYHFDLMAPVEAPDGWEGIFFVSLAPDRIARILAQGAPPAHRLYLLHRDQRGLIEVAAQGSRNRLDRPFRLSQEELASVLASQALPGTRWTLVDVVPQTLFTEFGRRERLHAFAVFAGFLGVALFLAHLVRREERGRTQAEAALMEANRALDARVRERTRELRQANDALRHEIEQRRRSDRALQRALERYDLAVRGSNDAIWDWDLESDQVYLSPRFEEIRGGPAEAATLTMASWLEMVHAEDIPRFQEAVDQARSGRDEHLCEEVRIATRGGRWRWCMIRGAGVHDERGRLLRMAGSITDVTERHRAAEAIRRYTLYDPLTGLPNHALFLDRVGQALASADSDPALLVLHVEGLRDLNRRMGRAAADDLLRRLAQRLEGDVLAGETLARISGSEFAWLIPASGPERVPAIVAGVQEALSKPFESIGGTTHRLEVRIGWASYKDVEGGPETLLRAADLAMIQARREGVAAMRFDAGQGRDDTVIGPDPAASLAQAIERGELRVCFQPLVRLADESPYGFEALMRWAHPERGLLAPAEFMAAAEESGLIVPMGEWVLREAVRQCRAWNEALSGPMVMSVNLSCHQFLDPDFVSRVESVLAEGRDSVERGCLTLVLEITETTLMRDMEPVLEAVRRLRSWGVRLAIDDFGTGYSSLSYLQTLPLDTLKLDQGFVARLQEPGTRAIVAHMIGLAHELSMQVVAEGIETENQLRELVALGADIGQGYWFGRPMDPDQARVWWRKRVGRRGPESVSAPGA